MSKILVIGYGNSLRSDDRIGIRVAEIVADWHLPEVRSLSLTQLTPELAVDLAQIDLVIFVDACQTLDADVVRINSLKPLDSTKIRSHFGDPRAILSLTQAVYGKCPQAWWVIVPGVNFQFGDRLSPVAEKGVNLAIIQIRNLIAQNLPEQNLCTKEV
ncbi:MAG: hydrogenase maturation protease [Xenococcaceae cyanobacterium MO_167.B27]|nr:hydrogenase maturation protease [Xenococcaceae cyanobacterium MO_167.B27]